MSNNKRPRYSIYPVIIKGADGFEDMYYCFKDNDHTDQLGGQALYYFGETKNFFKIKNPEDAIRFVNLINSKEGEYLSKI